MSWSSLGNSKSLYSPLVLHGCHAVLEGRECHSPAAGEGGSPAMASPDSTPGRGRRYHLYPAEMEVPALRVAFSDAITVGGWGASQQPGEGEGWTCHVTLHGKDRGGSWVLVSCFFLTLWCKLRMRSCFLSRRHFPVAGFSSSPSGMREAKSKHGECTSVLLPRSQSPQVTWLLLAAFLLSVTSVQASACTQWHEQGKAEDFISL